MSLIYCGIDEAGYGPLLGPLCVGCTVFRIEEWAEGDAAPDLWKLLGAAVCREASDKRHRIAVDDSKKLKLANSSVRKHPLHHLERGVLSFLACCDRVGGVAGAAEEWSAWCPCSDEEFFHAAGVSLLKHAWYGGGVAADAVAPVPAGSDAARFPCGLTSGEIAIAANTLRRALLNSGVATMTVRAEAVCEATFNELVEAAGSKAAVTESVLVRFLGEVWERFVTAPGTPLGVRVVCDRQGGRTQYAGLLRRAFPDAEVVIVGETPDISAYDVRVPSEPDRGMRVSFKVEAETAHLPVALASMLAKLTRELYMARFNRYWTSRIPDLKPTAGYSFDARRWLTDAGAHLSDGERRVLVRRA